MPLAASSDFLTGPLLRCLLRNVWVSHGIPKEVMRRSRTTRYETEGDMAIFTFSPAVSDEFIPYQALYPPSTDKVLPMPDVPPVTNATLFAYELCSIVYPLIL